MPPVPKPAAQRQRRNKRVVESPPPVSTAPTESRVPKWRNCSTQWHPAARDWYLSLRDSGQSYYYQPSDRMMAWFVAEQMSRAMQDPDAKAAAFDAVMRGAEQLLATERSRRSAHVELTAPGARSQPGADAGAARQAEVAAGLSHLDDARRRLAGS